MPYLATTSANASRRMEAFQIFSCALVRTVALEPVDLPAVSVARYNPIALAVSGIHINRGAVGELDRKVILKLVELFVNGLP